MTRRALFILFIIIAVIQTLCFAREINFDLKIEKAKISRGKQAELRAIFYGSVDIPAPEMPFIEGLNFKYVRSDKKEAASGTDILSVTHTYRVAALRTGSFDIGPVIFRYNDDAYISNSLKLTVEKEEKPSLVFDTISEKSGDISGHIYLILDAPKSTVFVNEELPFKVMLYSDWLDLENISLTQKPSENLIIRKFGDKVISNIEKNGVKYVVLEYGSSLFAATPGAYQLNPVEATLDVTTPKENAGSAPELLNDNKEFYDKFIGAAMSRQITLQSPLITITVKQLPPENKPEQSKGVIGGSKEPGPALAKDLTIVPLKGSPGLLREYNMRFYRNSIFILLGIIPILAVFAASIIRKRVEFLTANPGYAAMLRASKKAHTRFAKAQELLGQGKAVEFYGMIFNIMQSFLGERAIIPQGGVTAKILDDMPASAIDAEICKKIKKIFSDCYMAKYASAKFGAEEMADTLGDMEYVIIELDKKEFNI